MAATKTKDESKSASKPAAKDEKVKKARQGPKVGLREIGKELPANPGRSGYQLNRDEIIASIFTTADTPDTWFEVVHYSTRNGSEENPGGARKMDQAIAAGTVAIPEVENAPEGAYFETDFRNANYDGSDRAGSVLVARFVTEADTEE